MTTKGAGAKAAVPCPPQTDRVRDPRFRTFKPDGRGGWREVVTAEERREVARRFILSANGLPRDWYETRTGDKR